MGAGRIGTSSTSMSTRRPQGTPPPPPPATTRKQCLVLSRCRPVPRWRCLALCLLVGRWRAVGCRGLPCCCRRLLFVGCCAAAVALALLLCRCRAGSALLSLSCCRAVAVIRRIAGLDAQVARCEHSSLPSYLVCGGVVGGLGWAGWLAGWSAGWLCVRVARWLGGCVAGRAGGCAGGKVGASFPEAACTPAQEGGRPLPPPPLLVSHVLHTSSYIYPI